MMTTDMVSCSCFDGQAYKVCEHCGGTGHEPGVIRLGLPVKCQTCAGSGEFPEGPCPRCGGQREIPFAYSRVLEAADWVLKHGGEAFGEQMPGVTIYSIAAWSLRRYLRHDVEWAVGRPTIGRNEGSCEVDLVGGRIEPNSWAIRERFIGFNWGYGGEGPNGLAVVLADAGFFPTFDEAMKYVSRLSQGNAWICKKTEVPA